MRWESFSLLFQLQMQPGFPQSVLYHLQENERLRLQVYRLSKQLKEQQKLTESTNRTHQRHLETVAVQLTLFLKSINREHSSYEEIGVINVISNCLIDLEAIALSLSSSNTHDDRQSVQSAEGQLLSQWTNKLTKAETTIHLLGTQNQRLKREVTKLSNQQRQQQLLIQTRQQQAQAQNCELIQLRSQLKSLTQSQERLRALNDQLTSKIKEAQQISAKHVKYIRSTSKAIELQNQKLSNKQREAAVRESELITLIDQKQKQIADLKTTVVRYQAQLTSSKAQLMRIIEQDQRIKQLQSHKIKKQYCFQSKPTEQDHYKCTSIQGNTVNGKENIKPSAYNEDNRKFNLQDFNRKLSQTHQKYYP